VYNQRTMAVVFIDDAFHMINLLQLEEAGLGESDLAKFSVYPPMVFLRLPEGRTERKKFM